MSTSSLSLNLDLLFPAFEMDFDYIEKRAWLERNWTMSLPVAMLYLMCVFGGQSLMKSRKAFDLRSLLFAWNGLLAFFSFFGSIRTLPELLSSLKEGGLHSSICSEGGLKRKGQFGFWVWLFCVSKALELFDTAFLVLRKRSIVFIHWYHHASVLIFTWYTNSQAISCGRWYLVMNYIVHTLMYSYYAARTCGLTFHRLIPMTITGLQVTQMLVGFWVTLYAFFRTEVDGQKCDTSSNNSRAGLILYGTYFVLFFRLFLNSYLSKKPVKLTNGVTSELSKRPPIKLITNCSCNSNPLPHSSCHVAKKSN